MSKLNFIVNNLVFYHRILKFKHFNRTVIALGYHISIDNPPSRIKTVRLPNEPFMQSNGYKPAPLDLSAIILSSKMEQLIDQLAENTHNLWAKERIQQGWTYGLNEVST